jgi:hypothetical protein
MSLLHIAFDIMFYAVALKALLIGSCVDIPKSIKYSKLVRRH